MIYWGDEKIFSEEEIKTKDIHYSKKSMGFMQENYESKVYQRMLYMWSKVLNWKQFPHRSYVGKSISGGFFEI